MTKLKRNGLLTAMIGLFLSQPLQACWETDRPPIKLANNHVNVKFVLMGKPLSGAAVLLQNRKRTVSLHITADKDGWVRFPKVPSGNYKLIMESPSHESFDVVLNPSDANAQAAFIAFSADYCSTVALGNDPLFYDF